VEAHKRTTFSFEALSQGKLGITKSAGAFLAEAACYCLSLNHHPEPVGLKISGDTEQDGVLEWSHPEDENLARRTYADLPEAAEKGAYGVAIVVVTKLENIPAVEQSPKGTGVDYWLSGDDDTNIFKARLEISGILKGTPGQVQYRLQTKLDQTKASDNTKIPAHAAIVEFSFPEIRIAKRNSEGTV
jgi:hypothetical protein